MIAVDWGTTRLRLYRMDDTGTILDQRNHDDGVLASDGRFGEILAAAIAGWDDEVVVMCGMIGSRNGWHEMPYLDCPADNVALAAGMQRFQPPGFESRQLWLVPGLCDVASDRMPDVMRGEESQLAALLEERPEGHHLACLPGTHSKWVHLRDGRIERIATAMTGEVYALMRHHSVLGRLMPARDVEFDARAFDAGIERSADPGGLLHHLFGVRSAGLFDRFEAAALSSYLSGLLIGHEVRASVVPACAKHVHLIGSERLVASYAHALETLDIKAKRHPEHLAARGLHMLWRSRHA